MQDVEMTLYMKNEVSNCLTTQNMSMTYSLTGCQNMIGGLHTSTFVQAFPLWNVFHANQHVY
jgi:hypothetical protein